MPGKEESKQRADRLRAEIGRLKKPEDGNVETETPEMLPGESPLAYVQRRMRDLEKQKQEAGDKGSGESNTQKP